MDIFELSRCRRTIRFFDQREIPEEALRKLIDVARMCSCGSNMQRLRYLVVRKKEILEKLFPLTAWAGYVKPRRTPIWGENSPTAFIAVVSNNGNNEILHADSGAAIQSIQFAAWELGIGCCWIASFDHEKTTELLEIPDDQNILYLIALGFPAEVPVSENAVDGNTKYYLDEKDVLHVPKLSVDEITTWL